MANTGNVIVTERDMNPLSPTYGTTRTRTYQDLRRCPTEDLLFKVKYKYTIDGQWKTISCGSSYDGVSTTEVLRYEVNDQTDHVILGSCAEIVGEFAFYEFEDLVDVVFSDNVTQIKANAFNTCTNMTSVTLSNYLETIGTQAFYLSGLTSVDIPDSVTTIGNLAFTSSTDLANVTIGTGITSIGNQAFYNCRALSNSNGSFTIKATTPPSIGTNIFHSSYIPRVIYVPAEAVNTYKTASGWSNYASRIQAIPT